MKRTWKSGRKGTCGEEKPQTISYQVCPSTRKALAEYCKTSGYSVSIVVNEAIRAYVAKNGGQNVELQGKENGEGN